MSSASTEAPWAVPWAVTLAERMAERLPARFAGVGLGDYDATRSPGALVAKRAAVRFYGGHGDALVLVGRPGVGKTMLAAALCRHVAEGLDAKEEVGRAAWVATESAHREAMDAWLACGRQGAAPERPSFRPWHRFDDLPEWVNVAETLVDLRSEFGSSDRPTAARLALLREHRGILVLDDLGRERASDWTSEVVYTLVNARYEARLRTVVTTNLTLAELAESTYWPVVSRLADNGILVEVDGKDQRLAARLR